MQNTIFINGREKNLDWKDREGSYEGHHEVDGIPFDGHRVLWGFSYEPRTYLKESELSGDEWRKGGSIKIFRNYEQVFEGFCREPENALVQLTGLLPKFQDFDWQYLEVGRKVYYYDEPAIIKDIILEQGCIILVPDGLKTFKEPIWEVEEKRHDPNYTGYDDGERDHAKVEIFSPHIWWWRKE